MNVLNRKMFANRDARRKLASMGGILASSEELMGTAQKYAPGGQVSVEEYLVVIPGITNGPERMSASTLAYFQDAAPELMANATVLDRETAASQGFDISRLRPADITAVRRLSASRPDMGVTSAPMTIPGMDASVDYSPALDPTVPRPPGGVTPQRDRQRRTEGSLISPPLETGIASVSEGRSFGQAVGDTMRGIFQPVGRTLRNVGQPIGDELREIGQPIGEELRSIGQPIGEELRNIGQPIGEDLRSMLSNQPGMTTSDDALEAIRQRVEDQELSGRNLGAASLEAMIAQNVPELDVSGITSALLPPEPAIDAVPPVVSDSSVETKDTQKLVPNPLVPRTMMPKTKAQETAEEAAAANAAQQEDLPAVEDTTTPPPADQQTGDVGAGSISGIVNDPNLTPNQKNKSAADATIANFTGKDTTGMSTKERVKEYQSLFQELLGGDDTEANEEKWHNLAMIGFAIAAGEDPNALSNIANGLLEGTKMMQSQRAEERQREDKLTSMAIEQVFAEKAAERDAKLSRELASMRGGTGVGPRDYRNPADAYQDAKNKYLEMLKEPAFMKGLRDQGITDFDDWAARSAVNTIRQSYSSDVLAGTPFAGTGGTGGTEQNSAGPSLAEFLTAARKANPDASDADLTAYYNKKYGN